MTVVVEIGEDGGLCGRRSEEGVAQMAGAIVVPQRSLPGQQGGAARGGRAADASL